MLNTIWMAMIVVGVLVAALMGQLSGSSGIVEGMFDMVKVGVVNIVIPLSAIMMLWLGIMRLAETSGMVRGLAVMFRPLMGRLFPDVPKDHPAMSAMVMNFAANMLGLGNAATPLGLKAMQRLDELNPHKGTATNAMCTFLAINTSSVTLIPATAIAMLAAQGVAEPYAIVGTTLGATVISTGVAILAVKFFEKLPLFRIREEEAVAEPDPEENGGAGATTEILPAERRTLSGKARFFLIVVVLLFVGAAWLETFPAHRAALQQTLGLEEAVAAMQADPVPAEVRATQEEAPLWQRMVSSVSVVAIPFVLVFFILFAALKGIPVYEEFVEGAKEGWSVAVRVMPFIVAMLAALAILRNSGTLYLLQTALKPVLDFLRFPPELLPMALMRPLSGSGSQGVLVEMLANESIPDLLKYAAATMYGSTETTFYVLAVYFGSVAVRRNRHALAAGLCSDLAGVIASILICQWVFG